MPSSRVGLDVINRQQIIIDDNTLRRLRPLEPVDPAAVGSRPAPTAVVQPPPQEHCRGDDDTVADFTRIHCARGRDREPLPRQASSAGLPLTTRAQRLRQFAGIAAIGLDPLPWLAWNQRRRDHSAAHSRAPDLSLQRVSHTAQPRNSTGPVPAFPARVCQSTGEPPSARSAPSTSSASAGLRSTSR